MTPEYVTPSALYCSKAFHRQTKDYPDTIYYASNTSDLRNKVQYPFKLIKIIITVNRPTATPQC